MTEPDTIKLLRECDAGIKMGTASIGEVLEKTTNEKLKKLLETCKEGHEKLKEEIQNKLDGTGNVLDENKCKTCHG